MKSPKGLNAGVVPDEGAQPLQKVPNVPKMPRAKKPKALKRLKSLKQPKALKRDPLPDGMTLTPLSEEDKKITEEHKRLGELTGNFATFAKGEKEAYDAALLAAEVAEEHQHPTEMLDKLKTLNGFGLVNDESGNSYFHRLADNTLYGGDGVQVKYYYESGSVVEMTTEHPNYPVSDSDSGSETETDSESDSD